MTITKWAPRSIAYGAVLWSLLVVAPCYAAIPVTVELQLALPFEGRVPPPGVTELAVSLRASRSVEIELNVSGGAIDRQLAVALQADRTRVLRLPLRVLPRTPITVEARVNDTRLARATTWPVAVTAAQMPVALALDRALSMSELPGRTTRWLMTTANALPGTVHGYAPIAALVLDAASLVRLDAAQQRAFELYLARCGRTVVLGFPSAALAPLRVQAGCGGQGLASVDSLRDLDVEMARLLAADLLETASEDALESLNLVSAERGTGQRLVMFVAAYGALMLLVVARSRGIVSALLVSAGASLLAVGLWREAPPTFRSLSWWEQVSANTSRTLRQVQVQGEGMGSAGLSADRDELVVAVDGDASLVAQRGDRATGASELRVTGRLMSSTRVRIRGYRRENAPLSLSVRDGGLEVRNTSSVPSRPAVLIRADDAFDVPTLAPGARWRADAASLAMDSPALRLARRRTSAFGAALLLPLPAEHGPGWWLLPSWTADPERGGAG